MSIIIVGFAIGLAPIRLIIASCNLGGQSAVVVLWQLKAVVRREAGASESAFPMEMLGASRTKK